MAPRRVKAPATLTEVVKAGDYRASLEALRDKLAAEIEAGSGNTAALAKQLADVLHKLADMKPPEVSKVDDLAKRRAARRSAPVSKRATGGDVSGSGGDRAR